LEKKTIITAKIWIIAAIINFVLNIIAIPLLGIKGAAITTLISFMFSLGVVIFYMKTESQIDILNGFNKSILRIGIASVGMIPIILILQPSGIVSIMLTIGLSAIIYFALLFIFKEITKQEIDFFKNMIRSKI
jgi:O-antigen/teichoic acid export membrane protein